MPRNYERRRCKQCKRPREIVGTISARGLCDECGVGNKVMNDLQLHEHRGPYFEHWRRRCLAAFGVALVDDSPSST